MMSTELSHLSFRLSFLEKKIGLLAKTASAHAWGLLGSAVGYVFGSLWTHLDSHPFLNTKEVASLSYLGFLACYAIYRSTYFATERCLRKVRLLFIAEEVTEREYDRMRSKCLKKGELL